MPRTRTSPRVARPVALEDLDSRGLARAVRAEQPPRPRRRRQRSSSRAPLRRHRRTCEDQQLRSRACSEELHNVITHGFAMRSSRSAVIAAAIPRPARHSHRPHVHRRCSTPNDERSRPRRRLSSRDDGDSFLASRHLRRPRAVPADPSTRELASLPRYRSPRHPRRFRRLDRRALAPLCLALGIGAAWAALSRVASCPTQVRLTDRRWRHRGDGQPS